MNAPTINPEEPSTWVELGSRRYPVFIAPGLIKKTGELIEKVISAVSHYIIVSSPQVFELHGGELVKSLEEVGLDPDVILVPDGEDAKTWDQTSQLIGGMLDAGMDRKSLLIAFGGGSVGDLAGFASSIYLRGIRIVQIPTTLLGQVDSSIGGKTAVNHPKGKNLIGSFHQPRIVVSDTGLLKTLSKRQVRSGLSEVVKYGVIRSQELFEVLECEAEILIEVEPNLVAEIVRRCAEIKAVFVEADERDTEGIRAALNYGHTLGHAIEKMSSHNITHGEAVAIGMNLAAEISSELDLISRGEVLRQKNLLDKIGLKTEIPPYEPKEMLKVVRRDKKSHEGSIRFVLPKGIGEEPELRVVPDELLLRTLESESHG
ncbi:MAG: 3-dehydroquinate synthase [Candidatus Bathyarchaeia archaeon]